MKMSKYTVELRYLVESRYPLGLDKYPIFDEAYRQGLNDKIINHFMFREIAFETPGLFINRLNVRMAEIMPYYNQLYMSELLKFEPLSNFEYTETVSEDENKNRSKDTNQSHRNNVDSSATSNIEGSGDSHGREQTAEENEHKDMGYTYESDTPEQLFTPDDLVQGIYASTAHVDKLQKNDQRSILLQTEAGETSKSKGTTTSETTDNGTLTADETEKETRLESIQRKMTGRNSISGATLLKEFRETMLNIDMLVIGDLNDLFFALY